LKEKGSLNKVLDVGCGLGFTALITISKILEKGYIMAFKIGERS